MKKKYDYDAVNFKGIKKNTNHVSLAAMWNNYGCACFGFIASKKVGGAVERNHAKRRLKEVVRLICINSITHAIQNNHCHKLLSHCILQNTLNSSNNTITSRHLAPMASASSQQPARSNLSARPMASTAPNISSNLSHNNLSIKHQNRLQNMKNCPLFIKNEHFYTSLHKESLLTESLTSQLSCSFSKNIYQTNHDHDRILPLRSVSYVLIANAATYSIDWPILVHDVYCSIKAINNIYYVPNNRVKKY